MRSICKKYPSPTSSPRPSPATSPPARSRLPGLSACTSTRWTPGCGCPSTPSTGRRAVLSHFGIAPGQAADAQQLAHPGGLRGACSPTWPARRRCWLCSGTSSPSTRQSRPGRAPSAAGTPRGCSSAASLNDYPNRWQEEFFFVSSTSAAPWPCPVEWGIPSRSATFRPTLTAQEKAVKDKLLRVGRRLPHRSRWVPPRPQHGRSQDYPAGAFDVASSSRDGRMEAPVKVAMENVRAEKAAPTPTARAPMSKVTKKSEPVLECDVPPSTPSFGKKRKLAAEDQLKVESSASDISCPPGFSRPGLTIPPVTSKDGEKQPSALGQHHDGDTGDWQARRQLLQGVLTPSQERELAASRPANNVVASSYVSPLQTVNDMAFSLEYALELEDKLRTRDQEADVLREEADMLRAELGKAKAKLAETKEYARAMAERELRGYQRGMEDMKRAALRCYPQLDPARLVVPLHRPAP